MSKEIRWLWSESKGWVERGLISEEQAGRIRRLYPEPKAGLPWSMIIFSGLGAVIAGLGIILLFAYNWKELHRFAKLAIVFGGLIGLQAGGLNLYLRNERWRQFGEALCLLGTMLFGAGIWLIAQIYHIDEHFPNGFLIWGIGALAMAWALPSIAQGLLAVGVLCVWGCAESWGFDQAVHWAPALLLAGGGLLAWRLRSQVLLAGTLAAFGVALAANVSVEHEGLVLRTLVHCAAAFVAAGLLVRGGRFPKSAAVWGFFGWGAYLFCLYLLTFPAVAGDLLGLEHERPNATDLMRTVLYGWVPLVATVALWAWVGWRAQSDLLTRGRLKLEHWLLPLTSILCQALAMTQVREGRWLVAGAFNLVFLAIAAAGMARGCREGEFRPLVLGSVLLIALATARFFDLFDSLALRGVVFVMVGIVLGIEGVLFRKAHKRGEKEVAA
jgi:uncharacterized membrane protein